MLEEDPEIWVPVLEPADVHSVDKTIRLRFYYYYYYYCPSSCQSEFGERDF